MQAMFALACAVGKGESKLRNAQGSVPGLSANSLGKESPERS